MSRRSYEHHGMTDTPEYTTWRNMLGRCEQSTNKDFHAYGGRGIRVCDRWSKSFTAFFTDVGERPSKLHSLDRINVNGNYEPNNVRWATRREQQGNMRTSVLLTLDGETHCAREWSRRTGLAENTILGRYHAGWSHRQILTMPTTPTGKRMKRIDENPETDAALAALNRKTRTLDMDTA